MKNMVQLLRKQKQLLEIELQEYASNKRAGRISIHPETYYAKLSHAYKGIEKAITMLSSVEQDIYEGHKFTKH
mgnify:CR=1 FL=1